MNFIVPNFKINDEIITVQVRKKRPYLNPKSEPFVFGHRQVIMFQTAYSFYPAPYQFKSLEKFFEIWYNMFKK